ncbi:hypothetical protein EB796_012703 [Bugula neritina]|uniref:Uncharacterized protein n=1 Tax=Bugula neritina TaxID=10212 RepID=A0A7J7JSX2_BUGNE|nr:hypothetical protein EB796_012703 [Bugula neritina]
MRVTIIRELNKELRRRLELYQSYLSKSKIKGSSSLVSDSSESLEAVAACEELLESEPSLLVEPQSTLSL